MKKLKTVKLAYEVGEIDLSIYVRFRILFLHLFCCCIGWKGARQ